MSASEPDFAGLLADVASAIEANVPAWRVRLGEAVARWSADGVACAVLERALQLRDAPDVDGLLATFARAVERLRALERDAAAHDPSLVGDPIFRDPARLAEAEGLVARLASAPRAAPLHVDPETWVLAWPDVESLLIEDAG